MKYCPKCSVEHQRPGTFCSRACANSRQFTAAANKARSEKLTGRTSQQTAYIRTPRTKKTEQQKIDDRVEYLFGRQFETLGIDGRRERVFIEQKWCCNRCKASEWFGYKLTLELEHKDGNHSNNVRDNLEGLCPNCHSITPTWRGRNKTSNRLKISDAEMKESLLAHSNIRQALLSLGMAAKGHNYVRAKKLLE